MVDVWELHEAAMELVDKADNASSRDEAHCLLIQAFELEKEAALELKETIEMSAVRSLIYIQAIWLGIKLGRFEDAQLIAQLADNGYIHPDFKNAIKSYQEKLSIVMEA
jgi:hypothetical protein